MLPQASEYDALVAGAGPAGSMAAIALAKRHARVLLVDADPRACRRFAGEWLHPTGVAILDRFHVGRLEKAHARAGYGFVIHPDDREGPVELPYGNGIALSAEHEEIVMSLREAAIATPGVDYVPFCRVVDIEDPDATDTVRVKLECRETGSALEVRAARVVGADGRSSAVRKAIGLPDSSTPISAMAAVELRDVELPREGFGHVVLGGAGPALFYRISDDVVRGCLDVPASIGQNARSPQYLWDAFSPVLPHQLKESFRAALERGISGWAVNKFRPRAAYGRGRVFLAGDALGHVHPMTAMGMTLGLNDAAALAEAPDLESYARERRAHVPELLSNALYHCFRREDVAATGVRRAMFRTLRESEFERKRTMDILAGTDPRRRSFGSAFLKIAVQAIGLTTKETTKREGPLGLPAALLAYGEWMQWPAVAVMPRRLGQRFRGRSTPNHPLPFLEGVVGEPSQALGGGAERTPPPKAEPSVAEGIEHASRLLVAELERIATQVGAVPDRKLAGPATRMMRAITSTAMKPAMAARMTLGRRRLAHDGVPRLLSGGRDGLELAPLADLAIVLCGGASWDEESITSLAELVRALLEHQGDEGGFASRPVQLDAKSDASDLVSTTLACRALDAILRRHPDASDANVEAALARAAEWVRSRIDAEGRWLGKGSALASLDEVSAGALAIEALIAAAGNPGEASLRRALKLLASHARPDGFIAPPSSTSPQLATARALRAMVVAQHADARIVGGAARALSDRIQSTQSAGADWSELATMLEALAACEARRANRPVFVRARTTSAPLDSMNPADWAFCRESLEAVSRTFSKPIALLPSKLEVAVSLGYLLCRVADTVEDHPAVDASVRDDLFALFLGVMERGDDAHPFARAFEEIPGDDPELRLARNLPRVMRVFHAQSPEVQQACVRWVAEMARGMSLYSHRAPGSDGLVALETLSDLERYCYYVAGTVGHLLTDLFLAELGERATPAMALSLRENAESFATGLQLVNILKDVTDDRDERGVSFVPRTLCARQGMGVPELLDPKRRADAHAAVRPVFDLARMRLDAALEYSLTIPAEEVGIRLFCLLPLMMAARTLHVAQGNDAMFEPGKPVKISREEVEAVAARCAMSVSDDAALRALYAEGPGDASPSGQLSRG